MTESAFRAKIREKIDDQALQVALDANALRRVQGRINAFTSLPDWQERRQRAHAVRAQVIARLDAYLEEFAAKVTENGIIVHRAKDAAEANQIVLEIVEQSPLKIGAHERLSASRLIAKSKSMVTEEIGLNHALESAGHRVVETDLGEYIIQLRGERPSHIITPAAHLRRHNVGQLFHDKLGIPYTEDIPTLTNTARTVLREVFLTADVGVSGVNFAVAETGTLTLVTNEGNGRMVTTLPPVHIALMGMERLVPTLSDLELMLSLLPRSATGQKISVYTQLIQRPEAGQQKHLIIVDNGRLHLRDSQLREILYCIRCGACLNACPVFREIGGHGYLGADGSIAPYPGPIGSVVSAGLLGENFVHLAQASSLCGACKEACPVDIDLPKLLTRVRAGAATNDMFSLAQGQAAAGLPVPVKLGLQLYTRLAIHPGLFAVSQRLAGWGARLLSPLSKWIRLPGYTGWGYSKDFPQPAAKPFRARWQEMNQRDATPSRDHQTQQKFTQDSEKPAPIPEPALQKDRILKFSAELSALGGQVVQCSENVVTTKVLTLLEQRGIDRVQAWDNIPGIDLAGLTEAGISVQHEADESIKAGITGALAGIAETGTLVIPGGTDKPLSASLLPELHIAVLRAADIEQNLAMVLNPSNSPKTGILMVENYPSVALVSGPSRTADIEMTLTIGVHGPGELYVFLLV